MKKMFFRGLVLAAVLGSPWVYAEKVKVLLMGDTQYILNTDSQYGDPAMFLSTMNKMTTDPVTKDAAFLIHMGDIIETGRGNDTTASYVYARQGFDALYAGGMPYVLNFGNNDNATQYNNTFGLSDYTSWPSFVDNYNGHLNAAHHFEAGGVDWLVISVEVFAEGDMALTAWVEGLIQAHLDKKVIIVSHDQYMSSNDVGEMAKTYPNTVLFCAGHNASFIELKQGSDGHNIGYIRTCWHHKNLDSYVCVVEMDTVTGTMDCRYYSPYWEDYGDDTNSIFYNHTKNPSGPNASKQYDHPWSWDGFDFSETTNDALLNLVQNPSFEDGATKPDVWISSANYSRTDEEFSDGQYALKGSGSGALGNANQTISLTANTDYTIRFRLKFLSGGTGNVVFDTDDKFDPGTTPGGDGQVIITTPTGQWEDYVGSFNSGSETTVKLRVFTSPTFSGTFYVDEVRLEVPEPEPPPEDTEDLVPDTGVSAGSYTTESFDGRIVWVPNNSAVQLYFDIPGSFDFTPGQPVYVRIEYHDSGQGRLFAEYDSASNNYEDAEIHSRSSRVGQSGFVYSYQMFEFPQVAGGQSGGNDFRFKLLGTDGTPLRVASVQVSTEPYTNERFEYALSKPWLEPYAGPSMDFTDSQTVAGKIMTGYQGWFATPNDNDDLGWRHWGRNSNIEPAPDQITIDAWPYLNDYEPESLDRAGQMVHQDGRPAYLFSSRDPEVVRRHFRWMRKHNIDGAYLQRFVNKNNGGHNGDSEFVLDNVRKAANLEGRVWAIEYDVSGLDNVDNLLTDQLDVITNDWNYLVNDCGILDDPRYLHEGGQPVLFIWGFGTGNNISTAAEADSVIDWFSNQNLYLIGGVSKGKINDPDWEPVLRKYDSLLEWMERDLPDLIARNDQLEGFGMKLLPHAWPGFSWHNLQKFPFQNQYTARSGGAFYWTRIYNAIACGADQIFLGMFDEYDEGTSIMPFSDNHPEPYVGATTNWGHYIDNEGLDPFWYLQLSGAAREMLNGQRTLSSSLPLAGSLTPDAYAGEDATAYLGTNDIVSGLVHIQPADGLTDGLFVAGYNCRTNAKPYFYFAIDDAFCNSVTEGQSATIEVEYYDATPGVVFRLQYDSVSAPYTPHPVLVTAPGSGGWKHIRWNVEDAYFGNRQNGLSDLRIAINGGAVATIRRVSVFLPEEQEGSSGTAPWIDVVAGAMQWPELSDATGWRLAESGNLTSNDWSEIAGPFTFTNGVVQYGASTTNQAGFYRLQRPARQ